MSADNDEPPRSGLRNPQAAVRGVGALVLSAEALVMSLAIIPLNVLGGAPGTATTTVLILLAALFVLLAGLLGRGWAWLAASVLQIVLFGSGFVLHWSLSVLGVLFGLVWLYVLHIRRRILR